MACASMICGGMLLPHGESLAAENGAGIYLLGFRGPLAGIIPEPGVYFQNDFYFYGGSAGANRELPFNGVLAAGLSARLPVDAPTILWSTPFQIAGGNLAFSATVPIGGPTIDAALELSSPALSSVIARNQHDSVVTVGDPLLSTFIGWHSGNFHWNGSITVNVPVGDYTEGALANIAFHRWAADLAGAGTWLDPATGHELSGAFGFTFNGTNPATNYTTGTEFHLEYAAIQHFSKQFDAGLVGYFYQQLTADSGSGAKLGPFEGQVTALGGAVGYNFLLGQTPLSARIKLYREFDVSQRLQGTSGFLTLAMPLGNPMASK
jgi:hypothetical protein